MAIDKDIVQPTPTAIDAATTLISNEYKLDVFKRSELGMIIQNFLKNNGKDI